MSAKEHLEHFLDCVDYAGHPLPAENVERIPAMVSRLEEVENVLGLIPLLLPNRQVAPKNFGKREATGV